MCGCRAVEVNGLGSWANRAIKGQQRRCWKNTHLWVQSLDRGAEPARQEAGPIESFSVRPWGKCGREVALSVGLTIDTEKRGRSVYGQRRIEHGLQRRGNISGHILSVSCRSWFPWLRVRMCRLEANIHSTVGEETAASAFG